MTSRRPLCLGCAAPGYNAGGLAGTPRCCGSSLSRTAALSAMSLFVSTLSTGAGAILGVYLGTLLTGAMLEASRRYRVTSFKIMVMNKNNLMCKKSLKMHFIGDFNL